MAVIVIAAVAELALFSCVTILRRSRRQTRQAEQERFRLAAEEARRLAHNALIVEASMAELTELVIEETLREMGMEWVSEPY